VRSGALRKRVTIQRRSDSVDEYGGQSVAWNDVATVWASLSPTGGKEEPQSGMVRAVASFNIQMRYFAGLTPKDRLVYNGRIFDIVNINDVDERHREYEITAREGQNSG
jgi:SPP1 family predicted phage head-tail adaptor